MLTLRIVPVPSEPTVAVRFLAVLFFDGERACSGETYEGSLSDLIMSLMPGRKRGRKKEKKKKERKKEDRV